MFPVAEAMRTEADFWAAPDASRLQAFQAASRLREQTRQDPRHRFVVVIPVADRPRQLEACLDSLFGLCQAFAYGSQTDGRFARVSVLIADDSAEAANIECHRELAARYDALGLTARYFGLTEQQAMLNRLDPAQRLALDGVLGGEATAHKGASITRNITYLKLLSLADEQTLFYFIDSDQTFQVRVAMPEGDRDLYALDYFYQLDRIFSQTDAAILTGKVVGDPPVSPSVMAANFLADVRGFLQQISELPPERSCQFHAPAARVDDAAYHDMAGLFGFAEQQGAFSYACPLAGAHSNADTLAHFAGKLNSFFYGEHPTRKTRYQYQDALASLAPARTLYTGNYCFKPEALRYFIPFAGLRLRMAGPVLGRLLKKQLGGRFVSANLPMLHARRLNAGDAPEFRPGIAAQSDQIDLSGELERQFYGDVMLFTIEKLTAMGYPGQVPAKSRIAETYQATRQEMADRYAEKRGLTAARLSELKESMPNQAWPEVVNAQLQRFADNITHNFGSASPGYAKIEQHAAQRQSEIIDAIERYISDQTAWEAVLHS